uniref:RNA helicase n=1 Tax=Gouania willdenowi TaxID=441366 RepID=A0A8C5HZZ1_GOUWI
MSYDYGGGGGRRGRRGGRGHRDGSRERWDRGGSSRGHSRYPDCDTDRGGGSGPRDRPPPHLKGREIGLWYARHGAMRNKQADRRSRAVVQMDESTEQHITKLLSTVQKDKSDSERGSRGARPSTSGREQTAANSRFSFENKFREKLPSYGKKELPARGTIGETGCGKTTQVTQFILDDHIERDVGSTCRVVCTQPRRISAISVAERVAAERAESVGNGNSCGYQIRLQSRLPRRQGSILYCTTGIILQWLRSDQYSTKTIEAMETLDSDDKIDLDLILALIRYIVLNEEEGAILVFLPGWDNISTLNDLLMAQQMFRSDRFVIIPLHSLMPTVNQIQVFKKPPPGVRKIVIATNIAETSITIDDVVFVIDGGKIKETHFDTNNNISTMAAEWVSLANAKQRKGRAGRVRPGKCYHLYNGLRASLLDAYQLPEIMRTPLEELCLQIKNALDHEENLTALGIHLARLPVEPHIGKLILFGALLGCLDPVLTIAAALSFKDPFFIPLGKEKLADMKRKVLSRNSKSDHLTIVNAFQGWEDAKVHGARCEREYCWDYFLSANTLQMLHNMKGQFAEHLMNAGFVSSKNPKDPKSNFNSCNEKLIKAVIVAGLYPKVAMIRPSHSKKRPGVKVYTQADGKVCIHPKSVNAEETNFNYKWLVYHLKMRTSSIFLYDCTEVSPFSLLFFGGDVTIQMDGNEETIAVDQWIVFRSPARIAHLVQRLKKELDFLLQEKICNPAPVDWLNRQSKDCAVITAIIDLITTQEKPLRDNQSFHRHWESAEKGPRLHFDDDDDDDD